MKAQVHEQEGREKHSNKGHHKFFQPHKQFQLLYRSSEKLPSSSEQYESVFFMKHKKISPEKTDNDKKADSCKKKTQKKRQLVKKKIHKEKDGSEQASENFLNKNCKYDKITATKSTLPNTTTDKFIKSNFAETFRKTIDLTKSSLKKMKKQSISSSSRYLNSNSKGSYSKKDKTTPKKHIKTENGRSVKSPKKLTSPKTKKSIEKSILSSKRNNYFSSFKENDDQYILIDGKFVSAETPDCQLLQQKLRSQIQQGRNQFVESFSHMVPKKMSRVQKQLECGEDQEPIVLENFFYSVVKIQRWWKKIMAKSQKKQVKEEPTAIETRAQEKKSPTIDSFILAKEKTVINYMNHKKSLLNKLLSLGKISEREYSESLSQIEQSFHGQMREIIKMREMFIIEATNIRQMEEEIKEEQTNVFANLQNLSPNEIMEKFMMRKTDEQSSSDFQLIAPSVIQQNVAIRKKSTGCHIAQSQAEEETKPNKENEDLVSPLGHRHAFQEENSQEQDEQCPSQQFKELFEIYQDRQQAQLQIEKRHGIQLGMAPAEQKEYGISTTVVSIHKFMSDFLQFYLYFFKEEFLKMINMPYGYSQKQRLKVLQGAQSTNKERYSILDDEEVVYGIQTVLGPEILDDYHQHQYQTNLVNNDTAKAMIYFEQIHNRAIFDCFNEELNSFRPYYYINGPPYTWNYSERALTFYYIAEENIQEVFEKTQYKVLKNGSSLCGVLVESLNTSACIEETMSLEEKLSKYRECVNPVLMESREEKLAKVEKQEMCEWNYKWEDMEELRTGVMMEIEGMILEALLLEGMNECCMG